MSQLVLGTAEFNPAGYADSPCPSLKEIRSILSLAKEGGITLLDTAESYGCTDMLRKEAKGFCIYTKTRDWKVQLDWGDNELRGILYHYQPGEVAIKLPFVHRWVNLGVSVYEKEQLPDPVRILQIPFSIYNTRFIKCFETHRTIFVRSVFNRGQMFKQTPKDCLEYVKSFRPDGVIIGVKSVKELEQNLKAWGA